MAESDVKDIRGVAVAGQFYPKSKEELNFEIAMLFRTIETSATTKESKTCLGLIAPHAGFSFSGKCQAMAFSNIFNLGEPATFIIIGPNHTGIGSSSISLRDFDTPLGVIKNDKLLSQRLVSKDIEVNEIAHSLEHSVEMQVIFLKYLSIKNNVEFKIVPIILGSKDDAILLADTIRANVSFSSHSKRVILIVSSDFIHYGPNYGYTVFGEYKKEVISEYDKKAITEITFINPEGFIREVNKNSLTICGTYPIYCLLKYFSDLKRKKREIYSKLLCYYHSADILASKNSVSYASIGFFER